MTTLFKRIFKLSAYLILILSLAGSLLVAALIGYNNRNVDRPSQEEMRAALEKTIVWMESNEQAILEVDNPILWYRVKLAAEITGDSRLKNIYSQYEKIFSDQDYRYQRLWMPLFKDDSRADLQYEDVEQAVEYVKHWMYALHCAQDLLQAPEIAAQNEINYCGSWYLFNTTCTAHQMTAILFLKKNDCGDTRELDKTISALQARLVNLLTYDARVVDIYLQRAYKLAESGAPELIKPVWLRRILDAQQPDGGWANFEPLIYVGNNQYLGLGRADSRTGNPRGKSSMKGVSIGEVHSTFHATVQSLMLLTLLVEPES